MVKLGELVDINYFTNSLQVEPGDILVTNLKFLESVFKILLTANIETLQRKPHKRRPIVIYKTDGNKAYFFALSTSYDYGNNWINFDYKNCQIKESCKYFNFKDNAKVFKIKEAIGRKGKLHYKYTSKLNLTIIDKLLNSSEINKVNILCNTNFTSIFDFLDFCGECNLEYINEIVSIIEKNDE